MTSIEESIFALATALPNDERSAFLDRECSDDSSLRKRLDDLLDAHEQQGGILDVEDTYVRTNEEPDVSIGQDLGNYRLLQKIGEGGFGVVFMAEQRQPVRRKVAIKVIKPGMDSKAVVARFESERQALAMMEHPNIARVFDGGTSENGMRPYFVMELVQGIPITEFCDANALTTRQRLELFVSVCNAVQHAHQKGVIHRDVKPNNVLVTLHDGVPVVKVIDFGVAKALHQRLTEKTFFTQFGMMVGTPQYMSPEQAEMTGLDVDTRSDVYSLAVLLYELMTGSTPIKSSDLRAAGFKEMQRMICENEAEKPSLRLSSSGTKRTALANNRRISPERLSKEIRGDLDCVVLKGLEKDRNRRYDSASDLAADVRRVLSNQPVLARPPSLVYRSRKFAARNKLLLGIVMTSLVIVATVGFSLANHRKARLELIRKDTAQLINGLDSAKDSVVVAVKAATSNELWEAADMYAARLGQMIEHTTAAEDSISRAQKFLESYGRIRQDSKFTLSIEELLITHSTDPTVENLNFVKSELQNILRRRGFDLERLDPEQLVKRLKNDHGRLKVTDAIELWLMVQIEKANLQGDQVDQNEIDRWTLALCAGDPNPMRTAIRRIIFHCGSPSPKSLEIAIDSADLAQACARKLSWLAKAYEMVGLDDRAKRTQEFALAQHPDDLLLNFEHSVDLIRRQDYEQAIRYLMRCTSIRPQNQVVWKRLAVVLRNNNELERSQIAIEKAIKLDSGDAESHLVLAELLLNGNDPIAAINAAELALSLDDDLEAAWCLIGRSKLKQQDYSGALFAFQKFQAMRGDANDDVVDDWIRSCKIGLKLGPRTNLPSD